MNIELIDGSILYNLGNKNKSDGLKILSDISIRLEEAREKHPDNSIWSARGVIGDEVEEFYHALEHESSERQRDEALDVIATCIRFLNKEYQQ